jgi:hypothetical protein
LQEALSQVLSDPQIRPLLVKNVLLGLRQPVQGGSPSTGASEVTRGTFGYGEQGDRDYTFLANREGITPLTVQGYAGQSVPLQNWKDVDNNVLATVDAAGNVGIGTAAPSRKLTVSGEILLFGYPTGIYFGNAQGLYDNGGAGLTLNGICLA